MKRIKEIFNRIFHKNKSFVADTCEETGLTEVFENSDIDGEKKSIVTQCKDSIHEICILCLEPFI